MNRTKIILTGISIYNFLLLLMATITAIIFRPLGDGLTEEMSWGFGVFIAFTWHAIYLYFIIPLILLICLLDIRKKTSLAIVKMVRINLIFEILIILNEYRDIGSMVLENLD
jgi:ABC-type Fe3+-siderophore transport system permease subunit